MDRIKGLKLPVSLGENRLTRNLAERRQKLQEFLHSDKKQRADFWRLLMYWAFWIYLALFPAGYGWREVMPPLCLLFLLLYYHDNWQDGNLRQLKIGWLFLCLPMMALIGIAFSINPLNSLLHAGTALNKGFILPFIAIEAVHNERELRGLVWALTLACFWQGVDGVWQGLYGYDFIMGYVPNNGRLTGSLGDYTVGNYISLAMIPAWGTWFILRQKFKPAISALLFFALFWPAFFLFQGASSRSGLLALFCALLAWAILKKGKRGYTLFAVPCLLVLFFSLFQPGRLSVQNVTGDNRWDLWHLGWEVFLAHPLTGAGAGEYNEAFRALGLQPLREAITISHPHNLYLDLLYAHGISGFCLGMIFICGFLIWGWKNTLSPLKTELQEKTGIYWQLAFGFWLGFAAWLANGIFGHDFYRSWWLAQAMIALGIAIGATLTGRKLEKLNKGIV